MFNAIRDFFPTPRAVIEAMLRGEDVSGKAVLEPSAGKGDIVDFLTDNGAGSVIACEIDENLQKILKTKCKVIEADFLNLKSDQVSHVDFIVMNPPFSADEGHILHAYNIAPAGCKIIALCNSATIENPFSKTRKELAAIISSYGTTQNLGDCFSDSERKTGVNVSLVKISKPGSNYNAEFDGFFTDEEPEYSGADGIMSYNVVRDLVNRYVTAVKLYDRQLDTGVQMNSLLSNFYGESLTFTCTQKGAAIKRAEFKKDMQKAGWRFIFSKMNLTKHTTRGLTEDINKFVEQQSEIPFTMKNIYHMLDIVVQTTGQRMDKAILEAFDRITAHHHENRLQVKGWKTNSHFLVGRKFILPGIINPSKEYGFVSNSYTSLKNAYDGTIPDLEKALCFVTGAKYDEIWTVNKSINRAEYGVWYESYFLRFKGYKNGNMHFEFMDENVQQLFNQRIAKLKGFPLYERKEQTAYQNRQTGHTQPKQPRKTEAKEVVILATIKVKTA